VKKVVLDTNVTISALFWGGNPRKIYDLVREGKLIMLPRSLQKEIRDL
jgi:predicted nucleic acid-binding protein